MALVVQSTRCFDMYSTLAQCGMTSCTVVTIIQIGVPLSITDAEDKFPQALESIDAADQALRLWLNTDRRLTSQMLITDDEGFIADDEILSEMQAAR